MAPSKIQIPLKVLIHKQEQKVVFAEANSDFVDILFSFLTLPMGTIVRLLDKHSDKTKAHASIGSFNNLYRSMANLDAKYFAAEGCKDMLLNTRNSAEDECRKLKINIDDIKRMEYFTCANMGCTENNRPAYLSTHNRIMCTNCYNYLNTEAEYLYGSSRKTADGVFIHPNASFVITDDLQVFPDTPASTLAILKSSGIADCGVLEEKTFNLLLTEILNMLKCSILSKSPLTSLFLGKNCISGDNSFQNIKFEKRTENIIFKKMSVKVFVQKSNKKILLAHSSEDFIDFLFNCLAIPLGRFNSLFSKGYDNQVLAVKNIQQSVSSLNVADYFKSQQMKDILLLPQLHMIYPSSNQVFPIKEDKVRIYHYLDRDCHDEYYYFDVSSYQSDYMLNRELTLISPAGKGGYLKGLTKFMVTDDLVVTPFSSMSCINYIQSCKVPPSDIEEQVIDIGMEEATNLLRASLISTTVLTIGLKHLIRSKPYAKRAVKKPKVEE